MGRPMLTESCRTGQFRAGAPGHGHEGVAHGFAAALSYDVVRSCQRCQLLVELKSRRAVCSKLRASDLAETPLIPGNARCL